MRVWALVVGAALVGVAAGFAAAALRPRQPAGPRQSGEPGAK